MGAPAPVSTVTGGTGAARERRGNSPRDARPASARPSGGADGSGRPGCRWDDFGLPPPTRVRYAPGMRFQRLWLPGVLALCVAGPAAGAGSFVEFESGQVRPLALSPDKARLFAVNTPDDRLEVFDVTVNGLTHSASIPVGLEPVAVAARTNGEVWVVNHLSDSVSIVDMTATPPRVVRTLLVGDEPRDIVFAGGTRAFITTAHRGQNSPVDPQLTTPSVGRADVWVFDATSLGTSLAGDPLTIVTLFGDTPRALATDGSTVWAAVFHSGNQTTAISEGVVCDGGASAAPCTVFGSTYPGGLPAPNTNVDLVHQPETGMVVKYDQGSGQWRDQLGRDWSNAVRFSLPDLDVFAIDATASPKPVATASFPHVGTIIFNMAVNPVSGKVYVSNTDAHNEVRFEGPGVFGGSTVRGHLAESRITILDGTSVVPRHLNKHINYAIVPSPNGTKDASLATPTGMAVSADGSTLYLAAFGSSTVGVFSTATLEADTFSPQTTPHWPVTGGGPSGLVLDETRGRLYVLTRFDNSVSMLDTSSGMEEAHVPLFNPEPQSIVEGRPFLYDATLTSSNGEDACASCHIFGDFDSLAWDLGNPDDSVLPNLNPFRVTQPPPGFGVQAFPNHHPMKGPMTTQSLRGMANDGPMHWRGDRSGANDPGGDALDEDAGFKRFNVAFAGLLGNDGPLTDAEMQKFTDFILQVTYPPNPIRALNNSLTPDQTAGRTFFFGPASSDVFEPCDGCHKLDPPNGHFGTDGFSSFENETQLFKIPHLRNLYQKIGMFGMPQIQFDNGGNNGPQGPQVRGFGFLHDGSTDTIFRFHNASVFNQVQFGFTVNPGGFPNGAPGDPLRRQVEQFMFAFDSNLAPIVGQQVTLGPSSGADAGARVDLLLARATFGECDVVVKGPLDGIPRGWLYTGGGSFQSDRADEIDLDADLRTQAAAGDERTYTCVPPGSGIRIGIDRDGDGAFDQDEIDDGTDPANPASSPTVLASASKIQVKNALPADESKNRIVAQSRDVLVVPAPPGANGDPRCGSDPNGTVKAKIMVASATSGQSYSTDLPCQNWVMIGKATTPKGYKYTDPGLIDGTTLKAVWKKKSFKASLSGKGPTVLGYDLQVGTSQDPVTVEFQSGGTRLCLQCAAFRGKTGADGKQFLGKGKTCPAPTACAGPSSASGAFLDGE
jgi:DNA-binding beta-propeller fold protein YncE